MTSCSYCEVINKRKQYGPIKDILSDSDVIACQDCKERLEPLRDKMEELANWVIEYCQMEPLHIDQIHDRARRSKPELYNSVINPLGGVFNVMFKNIIKNHPRVKLEYREGHQKGNLRMITITVAGTLTTT